MIVDINNATPALDALREQDDAYDASRGLRREYALHDLREECAKGTRETARNINGHEYEAVYDEIFGYTCYELKDADTFDRMKLSPDALMRIGMLLARKVCQQLKDHAELTA